MVAQLGSTRASAALVFFTSEAAFDAASPQLSTQTFASATIAPIGLSVIGNPLNSSTSNAVFSTGSMLSGLTIASSNEHAGQDLGVVAVGTFGNPSKAIYNNFGGDSLFTSFLPSTTAVGMDLLNPNGTSINFTVDSPGGTQLGTQSVTVLSAGAPTFFGVIATNGDQIGRIELLGQPTNGNAKQSFAGMSRVVFAASPPAVPEPGSLVLVGLGAASLLARRASRFWRPRPLRIAAPAQGRALASG